MRFTAYIKGYIVQKFLSGDSVSDDMKRHNISREELDAWVRHYHILGYKGLKQTKVQEVRMVESSV